MTSSARPSARTQRTYGAGLPALALSACLVLSAGYFLAVFYAPTDIDQGLIQKIFYLHVPLALVTLAGFVLGALFAIGYLRTGDRRWDVRSYVSIHLSLVLGVAVLLTGAIWAKASWGVWWEWREPTLVSFLIVFLLYATYQPLRFSIEDPERQSRYAAVFAITAGAFVPLNFLAVRLAQPLIHPRVFGAADSGMELSMWLTFLVCLAGMALTFAALWKYEMTSKHAAQQLRALRRRLAGDEAAASRSAAPVTRA